MLRLDDPPPALVCPHCSRVVEATELDVASERVVPHRSGDDVVGAYAVAYRPRPRPSDVMAVWLSSDPAGPWSPSLLLRLPGCGDRMGEH